MKFSKSSNTVAVLFLAAALSAYAQSNEKEDSKEQPRRSQQEKPAQQPHQQSQRQPQGHPQQAAAPAQEPSKPSPVRDSGQRSHRAPPQSARVPQAQRGPSAAEHAQAPQKQRSAEQAQSWQQQRGWAKQGGWQPHTSFQQGRDESWASDHRNWTQRGGYGGSYIPQARFSIYFGSSHAFHIGAMPVMYMGYPRFAYGGYSFILLDPWPSYWQENWYASDDVYIDYSDGYYLHNRRYPAISLAVAVVL